MFEKSRKYNFQKTKITALVILFIFLLFILWSLHPCGQPKATKMDDYFLRNAQEQTGSNNVVTSIIFDYRGLDTLGEATVLFAAAMGVFFVFNPKKKLPLD
jgi:multisubunit Na+/H+ antiporter MnhB subunit